MGIDVHVLKMLAHVNKKHGAFKKTVTLGRQSVLLGTKTSKRWLGNNEGAWAEGLLKKHFGSDTTDSIDNSDYEGANILADLNKPIPESLHGCYDTVLDLGCTEHIFDVQQSFSNIRNLCKIGGLIVHAVPSNNCCGHGFYQFSPELFFSVYSEINGYVDTEVFLVDLCDQTHWFRVTPPSNGERINIQSNTEVHVMVVTRYLGESFLSAQQSDYKFIWSNDEKILPPTPSRLIRWQEKLSFFPFANKLLVRLDSRISSRGYRKLSQHSALVKEKSPAV